DALEAWWPPTLRPSRLGRIWLALWIIHDDSQSTLRSSALSTARRAARPSRSASVIEETSVSGVGMILTSRPTSLALQPAKKLAYRRPICHRCAKILSSTGQIMEESSTKLDRIDRRILSALQRNARIANQDLADDVGISASACWRRVRQLE